MKKLMITGMTLLFTLVCASLAMAAEGAAGSIGLGGFFAASVTAAGFGIGIAALGTGIGQGLAVKRRWKALPATPKLPVKSPSPC